MSFEKKTRAAGRSSPPSINDWRHRLKLIGDLNEIAKAVTLDNPLTSQQRRRVTVILRKLKYSKNPADKPLLRR